MILYYHATDHVIDEPNAREHGLNMRSFMNGNSALGLFANSDYQGSHVFGERLYSFVLMDDAKVLEIDPQMMEVGRCMDYYRGVRDALTDLGYHAVTVSHGEATSLVVLDFSMIDDWSLVGESV